MDKNQQLTLFLNFQDCNADDFDNEESRKDIFNAIKWAFLEKNCKVLMLQSVKKQILELLEFNNIVYCLVADWFDKIENLETNEYKANYFHWSPTQNIQLQKGDLLIEVVERKLLNSATQIALFELGHKIKQCFIIKDEQDSKFRTSENLPILTKFDIFFDEENIQSWLPINSIIFSLLDKNRFSKTNHKYKGATIYKEIATDYYWYLDTFHDYVEYEVFNSNGKCIGVANSEGKIDSSDKTMKKVGNRTIPL